MAVTEAYVKANPDDIITSEKWNLIQTKAREEIFGVKGDLEAAKGDLKKEIAAVTKLLASHNHTGDTPKLKGESIDPDAALSVKSLKVSGAVELGGSLTVTNVTVSGSLAVKTDLEVDKVLKVKGNLTTSGPAEFGGPVTLNDRVQIKGDLTLDKDLTIGGRVTVHGHSTFQGTTFNEKIQIPNLSEVSACLKFIHYNKKDFTYVGFTGLKKNDAGEGKSDFMIGREDQKGAWLDGNNGEWKSASDVSLKTNISAVDDQLEKVMRLRPVRFQWKSSGVEDIGFIAQEVEQLYPRLVSSTIDPFSGDSIKGISYSSFGVLAIAAIQQMKRHYDAKIAELEAIIQSRADR